MTGTLVNTTAIAAGGCIGILCRKSLPERYEAIFFQGVGLFTLLLGIRMSLGMSAPLLVLLSLILGGFAGVRMRLDEKANRLAHFLKTKTKSRDEHFTEGLIAGTMLFCMGSMGILGAIEEGLGRTSDLLLTKSVMDFFSALMLAAGLGVGVVYSSILLLLFQGGITLFVSLIGTNIPEEIVLGISATGGIILMGLSLDLLKIKKIEIINLLPSLLFVSLFIWMKIVFHF
jgi:uncharacterized membrane protein YqgA involved in biofilm formation